MPETTPATSPASAPAMPDVRAPRAEPEIHVIPEKCYGAALRAKVAVPGEPKPPGAGIAPPPASNTLPIILGIIALILLGAGGFVYWKKDLFFPPPAAPQTPVVQAPAAPLPPTPPAAPSDLVSTSTNPQSASLTWQDNASNESGFRVERSETEGNFSSLTNLPPNSTSFVDGTVQPGKTYAYRIIATNQGGESAASPVSSTTVPLAPPPPPEQPKLPPAGLDTDSDGLSDLEEALFATDPKNPDTDADGFLDGNEVFHLYNPSARAPGTLLDAGLVKAEKGTVGWSMYLPKNWTLTMDSADGSKATITSGHGEIFRLVIEDNSDNLPIVDWYLKTHPTANKDQVLQYRSKKGYQGIIGADLLTTFIPWGSHVFAFTYDLDGQTFINFRTTYSMMLNSLILSGLPQITAPVAGAPLPFEPAATTTGVIAQPVSVFPEPSTSTPTAAPGAAAQP